MNNLNSKKERSPICMLTSSWIKIKVEQLMLEVLWVQMLKRERLSCINMEKEAIRLGSWEDIKKMVRLIQQYLPTQIGLMRRLRLLCRNSHGARWVRQRWTLEEKDNQVKRRRAMDAQSRPWLMLIVRRKSPCTRYMREHQPIMITVTPIWASRHLEVDHKFR